ncbi:MAG TPA: hypothetical protein VFD54_12755, partial [Anaerolineales bacterium]|nr:hypothetical protein [Anaerolineales bacterium]
PLLAFLALIVTTFACTLPFGAQQPFGETPVPETTSLLPHTFYYLGRDCTGLLQVFRIEKDGKTIKQITFEPIEVGYYDVSRVDGSVAYVINNQLLLINADGSGRRVLVDG